MPKTFSELNKDKLIENGTFSFWHSTSARSKVKGLIELLKLNFYTCWELCSFWYQLNLSEVLNKFKLNLSAEQHVQFTIHNSIDGATKITNRSIEFHRETRQQGIPISRWKFTTQTTGIRRLRCTTEWRRW